MAGQHFLFVPGPTNVPARVLRAMAVPMEDHRSPTFPQLTLEVLAGLKKVFKTQLAYPIIFPSSGTGCWEAALTNTLNQGDKILVSRFGQFSHLWADMCVRLGFNTDILEVEWGEGAPVDRYRAALSEDKQHAIKAVLVCHNETATGVASDIKAIRQVMDELNHPALLMVDAVSSLGSLDFQMDAWGVDVCVSGSQKGLMLPAGMGVTCVSQKAIDASKTSTYPRCYFDYQDMLNNNAKGYFPYTPSIPMLYGLRESLKMIEEEGLDNILARHERLAKGVRAAVMDGWQLSLCASAPQWYSNSVSAIRVPEGVDAVKVIARAYQRYQLSLGAGLARLSGKVFRIGHLGDLNELMLMGAIAGAEMAMIDEGVKVEPGSGVAAAMKVWQS
ncbi:aminotransferase class V-fold PLP-dependent enzyme [Ferrovum sp. PN-J185]|uniref:aminotransferase class V-fold PLP-dependent enzyme n=1 Tax=Ferrovum sp. PN-J185 TaxID=1356306 RepID=UPI000796F5B5|nr:aminotransferase class V-fold PLP-dependent enzyme [Ferrovum sp. PN-J185]KXW56406.1 serine-pyruvate aminotransferase [Ferrovum sp. PN-J185]MCC6069129.1 aminotransferase class V-fold PLP-dependent enzyme [Ferrovum sp. PN-J185]MDE1890890.1 aminotransferase class V-fold PLP-dependent enzyme [Betaproteobacteria bacterium]MDE2055798.1 aminotransferase class V-fold PLP-dependent enzyme [Betaproteobacteria bacterium]